MKAIFLTSFLFAVLFASAQKKEYFLDYGSKPSGPDRAYYFVSAEKQDSLWLRQVYFLSTKTLASEGWYRDEEGKVPHGPYSSYHLTKFQKESGHYVDGKKEGLWLVYDDEGHLRDSAVYAKGSEQGIQTRWHRNGMISDSIQHDGAGNAVQVSWYEDGSIASAGRWEQDSLKKGRWKYFQKDGSILATEDFVNGKLIACSCFDEQGQPLDTALCKEKEARVDPKEWRRFLEKNLQSVVAEAARLGMPSGAHTVVVRFMVDKEGSIRDIALVSGAGYGIDSQVLKLMRSAPRWSPGYQFGRAVKSYHTQPITFVISK